MDMKLEQDNEKWAVAKDKQPPAIVFKNRNVSYDDLLRMLKIGDKVPHETKIFKKSAE